MVASADAFVAKTTPPDSLDNIEQNDINANSRLRVHQDEPRARVVAVSE
jgi:hypothetical protein